MSREKCSWRKKREVSAAILDSPLIPEPLLSLSVPGGVFFVDTFDSPVVS
jgi:hypothetical protein